jgi:uncharacterized protein YbjT (DUF2867 family)
MANVTVIGGHGKVALRLIPLLVDAGHEVTAWIRSPQHVAEVAATGASVMEADVEQLNTDEMVQRLRGQDAVIWSAGAGGGNPTRTYAVDRDAEAKAAADAHLQGSGLQWTILGPSGLTDEPGTGRIETGEGVRASSVSRDDVAAVAAYVVDHPSTVGRIIDFNNGETAIAQALGQEGSA